MKNILLVEPDYQSKFPPLGLLRISSYHKSRGDNVTFVKGCRPEIRTMQWNRIYVSSLFTYEMERTIRTIKYYKNCVESENNIIVGGIAATLMPEYIQNKVKCKVVAGPLLKPHILDGERVPIAQYLPDYNIIDMPFYEYQPRESYFARVTIGCIRHCKFCAVPVLEPEFMYFQKLKHQIECINKEFGERQNLVLLDNNILACKDLKKIIDDIRSLGFAKGAKRNGHRRVVDFNQGIDARLVTKDVARMLSEIALSPVRLAFDYIGIKQAYERAIRYLSENGLINYTNYIMFNFNDTPKDFYDRIKYNTTLSQQLNIRVTGFPMKYVPINYVNRKYVSPKWKWRYLRGIQCVLLATHGIVSPNPDFFERAFGVNTQEFIEILSMPDRYIIFRKKYESNGSIADWKRAFCKLSKSTKSEFLDVLDMLNKSRDKNNEISKHKKYSKLLKHYYPNGYSVRCE